MSMPKGPFQVTPPLVSLSTLTAPLTSRSCNTGPLSINKPVNSTASSNEPPPLFLRSTKTASTLSFLSSSRRRLISLVALLKSLSPFWRAPKSW